MESLPRLLIPAIYWWVELRLGPGTHTLPLRPDFEYGIMLAEGDVEIGEDLAVSALEYQAPGQSSVEAT